MSAYTKAARILCGLSPLMALFGCYSSPYQSGYGYGAPYGPGGYGAPANGYAAPGGAYQRSVPPPNDGNLGAPGKVNGTGSSYSAPTPAGGNNSAPANNGNSATNSGGKLVPDYNDPNGTSPKKTTDNGGFPSGSGNSGSGAKASDMNSGGMGDEKKAPSPFTPSGAFNQEPGTSSGNVKLTGGNDQQPVNNEPATGAPQPKRFHPPKDAKSMPSDFNGPSTNDTTTPQAPSPYDFDKKKYTWLRGRLDFDAASKSWQLMYSVDAADKFGGVLTLNDDPRLKKLRSGDVVLVEGKLDDKRKDTMNKPRYLISDLFGPLVPKSQIGTSQPKASTKVDNTQALKGEPKPFAFPR